MNPLTHIQYNSNEHTFCKIAGLYGRGKRITARRTATVLYSNTKHIQQFQTVTMTCYTLINSSA
jgi:hypothetical protein